MLDLLIVYVHVARARAKEAIERDDGATAIEYAIFALMALGIGAAVAGAIWLAVNNRIPGIQ